MSELVFRALFPFGGAGPGARGFLNASVRLPSHDVDVRFESIGGIDFDAEACADFEYLTDSPAWCIDVEHITVSELRSRYGRVAPDAIFMSPPCKGASGLISEEKAKTETYERMNRLALVWTRKMLQAWKDPPGLVLLENVPRLKTRAKKVLGQVKKLLRGAGYVLHEGFHDCGEIGGLAQHRRRYLLVARLARRVKQLLYQPPKKRVRACGEVLEQLPMPATTAANAYGKMHELPRISWLNWLRLALIPAGGDWRDLEGVLAENEKRREKWGRHGVADFDAPVGAVAGPGSNGTTAVADPRALAYDREGTHPNVDRIRAWDESVGTITTSPAPSSGAAAVADPRTRESFGHRFRVGEFDQPAGTVTSGTHPSNGAACVADPRPLGLQHEPGRAGAYGVQPWDQPAKTIAGASNIDNRPVSIADPRPGQLALADIALGAVHGENAHNNKYRIVPWEKATGTVIGATRPGSGGPSVADPRPLAMRARDGNWSTLGVTPWVAPSGTVAGESSPSNGKFSVADPRVEGERFNGAGGVMPWDAPARAVIGGRSNGAVNVQDVRVGRAFDKGYGVLGWDDSAHTIAGETAAGAGAFAVADPRGGDVHARVMTLDEALALPIDPEAKLKWVPVIIARDGTWHRPLTTLELAALQGIPTTWKGAPLKLAGVAQSRWRERIGNAVPVGTAEAIARQMLLTLAASALGAFSMSSNAVWVVPPEREYAIAESA